jgi:hypothetical protein
MTALTNDLIGLGVPGPVAAYLGEVQRTVAGAGTAQKTDAAAATADNYLALGINTVTTASSQTAVQIQSTFPVGRSCIVNVTSSTTGLVFPPSGCTIQGGSADASFSCAQNKPTMFVRTGATTFIAFLSA